MDDKSALRQLDVAPDRAAAFAYHLEDHMLEDLRLQFGMEREPRGWGIEANTIQITYLATVVGLGGYVDGSLQGGELCGRCGTNGYGSETGFRDAGCEGASRERERPCVGGILRR